MARRSKARLSSRYVKYNESDIRRVLALMPGAVWTSATNRSECGYGRGRSSTASITVKIAVVAPIPSASVSRAAAAKPGFRLNLRTACRQSFQRPATAFSQPKSRTRSRTVSAVPISIRAARLASSVDIPFDSNAAVNSSSYWRISSSRSRSAVCRFVKTRIPCFTWRQSDIA
jgi:hypothetical protein